MGLGMGATLLKILFLVALGGPGTLAAAQGRVGEQRAEAPNGQGFDLTGHLDDQNFTRDPAEIVRGARTRSLRASALQSRRRSSPKPVRSCTRRVYVGLIAGRRYCNSGHGSALSEPRQILVCRELSNSIIS